MATPGDLYMSAIGQTFTGQVVQEHTINQKTWTVIEVTGGESFKQILNQIYMTWEGQIWKGFTGPPQYANYWLWVELQPVEVAREFVVTGYTGPFQVDLPVYMGHAGYCFNVA